MTKGLSGHVAVPEVCPVVASAATVRRQAEALDARWVERIFERMHGLYGALWQQRWRDGRRGAAGEAALLSAKRVWAQTLGGFREEPQCIAGALEACTTLELPPTLPQFVQLCRQMRRARPQAVAVAQVVPVNRQALRQYQSQLRALWQGGGDDGIRWARIPPAPGHRAAWQKAVIGCVLQGDTRFSPLLVRHVADGVIDAGAAAVALRRCGDVGVRLSCRDAVREAQPVHPDWKPSDGDDMGICDVRVRTVLHRDIEGVE